MGKAPGFWFFTGDWLKDPELRFCSIFARGLLVDLLCYMFEASEQGYLSKPDGTARSDLEIVDAISGGSREEKLAGLAELEQSGVISRDLRGVLYSRRIARLAEISQTRQQNGSKGGSKTQANFKQTVKQKRGVSVSVSDSVSDSFTNPPLPPNGKTVDVLAEVPESLKTPEFTLAWAEWAQHRRELKKPLTATSIKRQLQQLEKLGPAEACQWINFTIAKGWQGLQAPDADWKRANRVHEPDPWELPTND